MAPPGQGTRSLTAQGLALRLQGQVPRQRPHAVGQPGIPLENTAVSAVLQGTRCLKPSASKSGWLVGWGARQHEGVYQVNHGRHMRRMPHSTRTNCTEYHVLVSRLFKYQFVLRYPSTEQAAVVAPYGRRLSSVVAVFCFTSFV